MATLAQKQLRAGSFRGVPFETKQTTASVGRRVQVHEYPQRDTPFVEDLGRKAREITFTAFVIGVDYIAKMQKLIEALEKPGSGTLIHPWLGKMDVTPKSVSKVTFSAKLRMASVELSFVESGEEKYPESSTSTSFLSRFAAELIQTEAVKSFANRFNLDGAQDFVQASVAGQLADVMQLDVVKDLGAAFGMAEDIADLASDAATLVATDPTVLGNQIANVLGLGKVANVTASWRRVTRQLTHLLSDKTLNQDDEKKPVVLTTEARVQENNHVLNDLVRQITVANIVGATAAVGTDLDRVDDAETVQAIAYQDLVELRDVALEAIDSELLKAVDDEVYKAIEDGYTAVFKDLTERAEQQAQLVDYTPPAVLPALVIAYDRYGDANRDLEIVERNKIVHEGFVAKRTIKLLSE